MTADDTIPRVDGLLGQTLAERYKITRKIGEGGMGTVYEAQHVVLQKSVAVKVLREKYADRPAVAQRLVQEARLASAIRHDHIIDITDSGKTDDGRTFVVMELIVGQSLAELLRREGALPEARVLNIALQVAGALGAAHERGIVHRDVKPENILLADGDFAKVVDFGISKNTRPDEAAGEENRLTSTGVVMGTPFYMSPEQARGEEEVDHRIDVYALGVILYECLTGEVPFRGANYLGILQRVANDEATPPRLLRPELSISEAAERVVRKAMAKVREQRYPTMAALESDVKRVLAGQPIDAPPSLAPKRRARRVTALQIAVGAAIVAGVAGIVFFVQRSNPPPAKIETPPVKETVIAPPPPAPPPAANVVLHVESVPAGAEVRDGDRVLGRAPRDVMLPRSSTPVKLTFHLDGYDVASAEVVPLSDYPLQVKLDARPKQKRPRPPQAVKSEAAPPREPEPLHTETLPNPYGKTANKK